ncbi:serine hydrolase domain-containing protein [Clostridium hydrogenum]|uniref:serine hydrolase domain-containing protein n=1 Tax=Clostridium hydrogenum TaxID=2855764 RepID=UPI001F25FB72|nr:serine hydrolase domain-containing protein [Clostridium hydrogenum]
MKLNKEIEQITNKYAKTKNFSGTALVKRGEELIYSGAFGYAHRGFKIANNIDTKFDIASITKTFTAVAIMQLVDQGKINLQASITKYVDLKGTRIGDKVKIFHLLTYSSGIADDADEEAGESYEAIFKNKPTYSVRNTIDFIPQFAYKEPVFEPGTGVRYNNCAFVLLGLAIESVTGMSYREYVDKNIFKAVNMQHTKFCAMDDVNENTAEGYNPVEDKEGNIISWRKNIFSYPPIGSPDGGAYSTVGDLDIFFRALKDGKLLSKKSTEEILKPHVLQKELPDKTLMTGYAFFFRLDKNKRVYRISKEGENVGVQAMFGYYPEIDTTSAILANQPCELWNMYYEIEALLIK